MSSTGTRRKKSTRKVKKVVRSGDSGTVTAAAATSPSTEKESENNDTPLTSSTLSAVPNAVVRPKMERRRTSSIRKLVDDELETTQKSSRNAKSLFIAVLGNVETTIAQRVASRVADAFDAALVSLAAVPPPPLPPSPRAPSEENDDAEGDIDEEMQEMQGQSQQLLLESVLHAQTRAEVNDDDDDDDDDDDADADDADNDNTTKTRNIHKYSDTVSSSTKHSTSSSVLKRRTSVLAARCRNIAVHFAGAHSAREWRSLRRAAASMSRRVSACVFMTAAGNEGTADKAEAALLRELQRDVLASGLRLAALFSVSNDDDGGGGGGGSGGGGGGSGAGTGGGDGDGTRRRGKGKGKLARKLGAALSKAEESDEARVDRYCAQIFEQIGDFRGDGGASGAPPLPSLSTQESALESRTGKIATSSPASKLSKKRSRRKPKRTQSTNVSTTVFKEEDQDEGEEGEAVDDGNVDDFNDDDDYDDDDDDLWREELHAIANQKENKSCADCGSTQGVTWASSNMGVFLCIRCAGAHRALGAHISKVLSLTLDKWTRAQVAIMRDNGNAAVNAERAGRVPDDVVLEPSTPQAVRNLIIKTKYSPLNQADDIDNGDIGGGDGDGDENNTKSKTSAGSGSEATFDRRAYERAKRMSERFSAQAVSVFAGVVVVRLIEARNLRGADLLRGKSDPFCYLDVVNKFVSPVPPQHGAAANNAHSSERGGGSGGGDAVSASPLSTKKATSGVAKKGTARLSGLLQSAKRRGLSTSSSGGRGSNNASHGECGSSGGGGGGGGGGGASSLAASSTRQRSKTIRSTLSPRWNDTFLFNVSSIVASALRVHVYDYDRFSKDDLLGTLDIDLAAFGDNGDEREQWFALREGKGEVRMAISYTALAS